MKKYIIYLLLAIIFLPACQDVLDKKPLNMISDATLWTDPKLIDVYLDQCYSEMDFAWETEYGLWANSSGMQPSAYDLKNMVYSICNSDEASYGWVPCPKPSSITINGGVMEWWGYPTVRKLNIFLEKMTSLPLPEAYKMQRMAEARFLRAFCYFNMVKRYGGVPLITRSQQLNDSQEELYRKRDKEQVIYDFVLSELDAITPLLPVTTTGTDAGRPSKYAALSLKSRAAMYAGSIASWGTIDLDSIIGIPQDKALSYWQATYDTSDSILKSGKYTLYNKYPDKVANFRNLFLDEGNSESIFSERFDGISGKGHSYDMYMVPYSYHVWGAGQVGNVYLEMVESFGNIDGTSSVIDRNKIKAGYLWTVDELFGKMEPRFKASVYTQGTSWMNGTVVLDYHGATITPSGQTGVGTYNGVLCKTLSSGSKPFGVLKYLDEVNRSKIMERCYSSTDYMVFRLGEIYLNYAEAAIELGKNADALWAVNELRKRAGVAVLSSITRDLVRKERKVELAFEGNRLWDLRRWRIATTELSKSHSSLQFVLDGSSYVNGAYNPLTAKYKIILIVGDNTTQYFNDKLYYWPITKARTANNPNLVENPGYY